jgi:hypothetical protein
VVGFRFGRYFHKLIWSPWWGYIYCSLARSYVWGREDAWTAAANNSSQTEYTYLCIPGLPDFWGTTYQNWKNIPKNHKMYQMVIKYTKWP